MWKMYNHLTFIICFLILISFSLQQYQQFSFLKGKRTVDLPPVFGTTGEYGSDVYPGSIQHPSIKFLANKKEFYEFYGYLINTENDQTDSVWGFSLEKKQWKYVKGRRGDNDQKDQVIVNPDGFESGNQIGFRKGAKVWTVTEDEGEIIGIFGGIGYATLGTYAYSRNLNDVWFFNVSSSSYFPIKPTFYTTYSNNTVYGKYETIGEYHIDNRPGGRYLFGLTKINEDEMMIFGGYGRSMESYKYTDYLQDYHTYSVSKNQWKYNGGDLSTKDLPMQYIEKNKYHKNNTMGVKGGFSAVKINDEEILIFGGRLDDEENNILQKYNITSNQWMYLSGDYEQSDQSGNDKRIYDEDNAAGSRTGHGMWQINEDEVLLFGGYGYTNGMDHGFLNDQWLFNTKTNLWRYTARDTSKFISGLCVIGSETSYSEFTMIGGLYEFAGEYIENESGDGELYIFGGYGSSFLDRGLLGEVWKSYYGKMCFQYQYDEEEVCSKHGLCVDYNTCNCFDGYYGEDCSVTLCVDKFSNDSTVCSQKGICVDGHCLCYENTAYTNPDCTENEELAEFMGNLPFYIGVPIGIIIFVLIIMLVVIGLIIVALKLRKTLKKFDGIEDVDLILHEAKIEQSMGASKAKIEIDKSLFEVDYKDIKLLEVLGDGGSSSVIYLAEWKGQQCAYKGFESSNFTNSEQEFSEFEREVKIFSSINHPSILQFYGACVNPPKVGILLQYCKNGDLSKFLGIQKFKFKRQYGIKGKIRLLKEIGSGMQYLHSINLLHRDLKPENVLVDDNEHAKIMDFGLSRLTAGSNEKTMTKQIGTSYYMAPEVYQGRSYSNKCDVYSFAILILVVITENFTPFGTKKHHSAIVNKVANSPKFRPKIDESKFQDCKYLIRIIKKNWDSNPEERDSFTQIVEELSNIENELNSSKIRPQSTKPKKSTLFESLDKKNRQLEKKNKDLIKLLEKQKREIAMLKERLSGNPRPPLPKNIPKKRVPPPLPKKRFSFARNNNRFNLK